MTNQTPPASPATDAASASSAAAGHLDVKVPFEVGIRRGVALVAVALTFTWVTWAVADVSSMILPLFNLPATYELEGWYRAQQIFSVVMLAPLILGAVWLTRWPGPASQYQSAVRALVVVGGVLPPFLRLGYSMLDGLHGIGNVMTAFFELAGLVGMLPLLATVMFCSHIMKDRGNDDLAKKLKSLAGVYAVYRLVTAGLFTLAMFFGFGFGIFSVARFVSFIFLGLFLWAFTKTWRSLV
jgi:hypothetical protein